MTIFPLRDDIRSIFGERLNKILDERGMRPGRGRARDLSLMLDISIVAASKYLQGKMCPDLPMFLALANRLHVSIDYLLGASDLVAAESLSTGPHITIPLLDQNKTCVDVPLNLIPITEQTKVAFIHRADYSFSDTVTQGEHVLFAHPAMPLDTEATYLIQTDSQLRYARLRAIPRRIPHTLKIDYGNSELAIEEWRKVNLSGSTAKRQVYVLGKAIGKVKLGHSIESIELWTEADTTPSKS